MRAHLDAAVGWRKSAIRAFLALSDLDEQRACWHEHLDTRRFRCGLDALLSPWALRAVYAPRFLSILPRQFGAVLRKRLEASFARHPNATNANKVDVLNSAHLKHPAQCEFSCKT